MYTTIDEIKQANKDIVGHWFDSDTMSFFNSRVVSEVIDGKYFITSEKFDDQSPRLFTVREADDEGRINSVSNFQEFKSISAARTFITRLN